MEDDWNDRSNWRKKTFTFTDILLKIQYW